MNRRSDSGNYEQRGQRDHNAVGEIVDGKKKGEESDEDEHEGLQERVGHMKYHVAPEHNHDDGATRAVHSLDMQGLQLDLVFHKLAGTWKVECSVQAAQEHFK